MGKFEDRVDEGIFHGYSFKSKAYQCYNKILRKIMKNADVKLDEENIQMLSDYNDYHIYEDK